MAQKLFNLNTRQLSDGSYYYEYDIYGKHFTGSASSWEQFIKFLREKIDPDDDGSLQ